MSKLKEFKKGNLYRYIGGSGNFSVRATGPGSGVVEKSSNYGRPIGYSCHLWGTGYFVLEEEKSLNFKLIR